MNTEQQDKSWACLPKEARNYIRSDYEYYLKRYEEVKANTSKGAIDTLEDLFGHHNLTSDTEPSELLFVEKEAITNIYEANERIIDGSQWSEDFKDKAIHVNSLFETLFGDKCLPDKEPSVQVEPKFKVGDKVRVLGGLVNKDMEGKMAFVTRLPKENHNQFIVTFENGLWTELPENNLEPYTEPSNVPADETKDETKDNMEEKELNLAKLLKGCEGERMSKLEREIYDYAKMCSMDVDGYKAIEAAVIFGMELAYKGCDLEVKEALQKFHEKHTER